MKKKIRETFEYIMLYNKNLETKKITYELSN